MTDEMTHKVKLDHQVRRWSSSSSFNRRNNHGRQTRMCTRAHTYTHTHTTKQNHRSRNRYQVSQHHSNEHWYFKQCEKQQADQTEHLPFLHLLYSRWHQHTNWSNREREIKQRERQNFGGIQIRQAGQPTRSCFWNAEQGREGNQHECDMEWWKRTFPRRYESAWAHTKLKDK